MQTTQLPQGSINFESLANATVKQTMEGSDTPFRDAISSFFSLTGNTLATADALVCGIRYYAEDWKHESAHDFIHKSARLDEKQTHYALRRELENRALLQAMNTEPTVA